MKAEETAELMVVLRVEQKGEQMADWTAGR
jgi:hypothetical protein